MSPGSGAVPTRIVRVEQILRRYISPLLVQSVMNPALEAQRARGLPPLELVMAVVEDCMIGLRVFVPEGRLPELMIALAEVLEEDAVERRP